MPKFPWAENTQATYVPPKLNARAEAAIQAMPVNLSSSLHQLPTTPNTIRPSRMPGWKTTSVSKKKGNS
jgi:hypothetical protein